MGLPPYLSVGLPLLVGLLGIGWLIFSSKRNQEKQYDYSSEYPSGTLYDDGYDRPRSFPSSDSENCVICFEEMSHRNSSTLECGHTFHRNCLTELINKRIHLCPVCRARI